MVSFLARKQKVRARDDLPTVPRSLFDCPQTIAQRMEREREARLLKQQGLLKPGFKIQLQQPQQQMMATANTAAGAMMGRPVADPTAQHETVEWLIYEDWALLQASCLKRSIYIYIYIFSPNSFKCCVTFCVQDTDLVKGIHEFKHSPVSATDMSSFCPNILL